MESLAFCAVITLGLYQFGTGGQKMDDYIDRQAAIDVMCDLCGYSICQRGIVPKCRLFHRIRNLPPADVKPVVRGKWKKYRKGIDLQCSNCYWSTDVSTFVIPLNFCPNCGSYNGGDFSVDE